MRGFIDTTINRTISRGILRDILSKVLICCEMMKKDCLEGKMKIKNLEEDIRDYLFHNYLNDDDVMAQVGLSEFRFFPEVPDNYQNNKPVGRIDLQVISIDMFRYRERYFTIECKRIDGSKTLNRYYIDEGIKRFVKSKPLYPSYFEMNSMFGFVVKEIDINKNMTKINDLQKEYYKDIKIKTPISSLNISLKHNYTFESEYFLDETDILLFHIFYDFSSIIDEGKKNILKDNN